MNIRQAVSTDSKLLSSLCMDVQQLHAQHHPTLFKTPQSTDFAVPFFDKLLAEETTYIYIAEDDGEALGYIFFKLVERTENPFLFANRHFMIDQISVRPQAQKQGVGKALMQQVEIKARELGISTIHLGSWDFNTNAHGFFETVGYSCRYFEFWKAVK